MFSVRPHAIVSPSTLFSERKKLNDQCEFEVLTATIKSMYFSMDIYQYKNSLIKVGAKLCRRVDLAGQS